MSETNKSIVRRIFNDILNSRNRALVDDIYAPNYAYHGPGGLELRGREGFQQLFDTYLTAFPDMTMTIDGMVAEGDTVVTCWTGRGTHRGELNGIGPTGRAVIVTGIIVSRLENGQVVDERESFDELSMLRQIGVTTLPAAAAAV